MAHKFKPENIERLSSPERVALLPAERALELAGVRHGERVLDVGCGSGYFTIPLARRVGTGGHVHALDIQPPILEACREQVAASGLGNVILALSEESRFPLPDAAVDMVFASNLMHELEDPPAFLAEVRRVLAPGGRLCVIDWEKIETGIGPPVSERLTPEETETLLARGGFRVVSRASVSWANYLLLASP